MRKEWFMLFRYPVPADLEYYLEEQASQGSFLEPLGEKGLFYYTFTDTKSAKCKYMVDVTKLPKAMYMETLLAKGWEYLGSTGNCYVWKQIYENERPVDLSDRLCKLKHCRNGMILALIMAIVFIVLAIGLAWLFYNEVKYGAEIKHYLFLVEAIINIPLGIISFIISRKFARGINMYK